MNQPSSQTYRTFYAACDSEDIRLYIFTSMELHLLIAVALEFNVVCTAHENYYTRIVTEKKIGVFYPEIKYFCHSIIYLRDSLRTERGGSDRR